jgi:ankyrin repeat protein
MAGPVLGSTSISQKNFFLMTRAAFVAGRIDGAAVEDRLMIKRLEDGLMRKFFCLGLILWAMALLCAGASAGEIHDAAYKGDLAKVEMLLKNDPKLLESKDEKQGGTPLHFAVLFGRASIVKLLLSAKAQVNPRAKDGMTPLHLAAANDRMDEARLLLGAGADVNATDGAGKTPLHWAATYGYPGMTELLIKSKAGVNLKDRQGLTPLATAEKEGHKDAAGLIKKSGGKK